MQCLTLSLRFPCAHTHACTRIFKHFSIAVSTLQSFKRLRTNRREEKQERGTSQAAHFYGWQDKCRRYSSGRVPQFDKNTTACTHRPTNGMSTYRANKTAGLPSTKHSWNGSPHACSYERQSFRFSVYVCACMSLCAVQGQLYLSSSSSVLLMETALFAVDGYRMLSTHTLGTKPSSDECSNIAVTPNASTHYTRTRSLCFQLWRVYAGPFSSVWILSLSLAVTLPPIHPRRLPPPSPCPSLLPSDSLGCDNPFWQLMLFLGQS